MLSRTNDSDDNDPEQNSRDFSCRSDILGNANAGGAVL